MVQCGIMPIHKMNTVQSRNHHHYSLLVSHSDRIIPTIYLLLSLFINPIINAYSLQQPQQLLQQSSRRTKTTVLSGIKLSPSPLRHNDPDSPWCYTASIDPTIEEEDDNNDSDSSTTNNNNNNNNNKISYNFLASQVWPSARVAAMTLQIFADPSWNICEWGCGPGLPSLTFAKMAANASFNTNNTSSSSTEISLVRGRVIATDVDEFALDLVKKASIDQQLTNVMVTKLDMTCWDSSTSTTTSSSNIHGENNCTRMKQTFHDIINLHTLPSPSQQQQQQQQNDEERNNRINNNHGNKNTIIPKPNNQNIDLFILSDIFESPQVARGAACLTYSILFNSDNRSRVWCFAQTDRATQREVYVNELKRLLEEENDEDIRRMMIDKLGSLEWDKDYLVAKNDSLDNVINTVRHGRLLWLCDVDECNVNYF